MNTGIIKIPKVTVILVAINVVLFVGPDLLGIPCTLDEMLNWGGVWGQAVMTGGGYRLVTSAFLHFSISHLMNNMLMLAVLGSYYEYSQGPARLAVLYVASAVGANIVSCIWYDHLGVDVLCAGASGAVFGIIGALFAVAIRGKGNRPFRPAALLVFAAIAVYSGFTSATVNNAAHISGLIFGVVLGFLLFRRQKQNNFKFGQ